MKQLALYPTREIQFTRSFKGTKKLTVPRQSLSLREILRRFVRRESVPVSKDGVYEDRFGDLEKMARGDIFDQFEHANWLAEKIAEFNKRDKLRYETEVLAAQEKQKADIIAEYEASKKPPVTTT